MARPVGTRELEARVRALIRRTQFTAGHHEARVRSSDLVAGK
jgi:DNA-binding response OmpR family regulator